MKFHQRRGGRRGGRGGGRCGRGGSRGGGRNGRGGRASENGRVGAHGGSHGRQCVAVSADDREASTSAGQRRGLQRLRESVSSDIEDQPRATRQRLQ